MRTPNEPCPFCEEVTQVEILRTKESVEVRGESFVVDALRYRCAKCGEKFTEPLSPDAVDPLDLAYREYRRKHGMLQPEEIRAFRESIGLSQKELARLLGFGEVTLSRYENGSLQDEVHDRFLRLVSTNPSLLHQLRARFQPASPVHVGWPAPSALQMAAKRTSGGGNVLGPSCTRFPKHWLPAGPLVNRRPPKKPIKNAA